MPPSCVSPHRPAVVPMITRAHFLGMIWRAASALLLCLCSACIEDASPSDLRFAAISPVDRYDLTELPPSSVAHIAPLIGEQALAESGLLAGATSTHRPMLKAEFTSSVDLSESAVRHNADNVANSGYLCERPKDYVVLVYPGVYSQGHRVAPEQSGQHATTMTENGTQFRYYLFLEVARKASLESRPPQIGFDFRVKAEDVCFYFVGGNPIAGRTFQSNIVTIPAQAIATALSKGP